MSRIEVVRRVSAWICVACLAVVPVVAFAQDDDRPRDQPAPPARPAPAPPQPAPPPALPPTAPEALPPMEIDVLDPEALATCPHPVARTLSGPATGALTPTPFLADFPPNYNVVGSVFAQTQANKHFGHTFRWKTKVGGCCLANPGQLIVTYRAVSRATSHTTGDAGNDGGGPVRNGQLLAGAYGHIWPSTGAAAGTVVTRTYVIPAGWIASGRVSFTAQDDTSVVSARLIISGCCLVPTPADQ